MSNLNVNVTQRAVALGGELCDAETGHFVAAASSTKVTHHGPLLLDILSALDYLLTWLQLKLGV